MCLTDDGAPHFRNQHLHVHQTFEKQSVILLYKWEELVKEMVDVHITIAGSCQDL